MGVGGECTKLTYDKDDTEGFELDGQRSIVGHPFVEEPRARERDS